MAESKSNRNKTLDMSVEDGKEYLAHCLCFDSEKPFTTEQIKDKTINGNTFKVLPCLPKAFADLAIVDPPYNLSKNYAGNKFNERSMKTYASYTKEWLGLVLPLLKPDATLYVCCDWKSSVTIADVLFEMEEEKKLCVQNRITWQREKGRGSLSNWKNGMEDIWYCTLPSKTGSFSSYTFNLDAVKLRRRVVAPYKEDGKPKDWTRSENGGFRDTCPSNFWDDISIPFWSMSENTAHPTQKPEKLIAKLILASSNKGDIVLDPFLGSGTTSVTAKKLARHYVGIEQSEQYCVWAEKRLSDAEIDKSIQGYTDGVFWERNTLGVQKKAALNKEQL